MYSCPRMTRKVLSPSRQINSEPAESQIVIGEPAAVAARFEPVVKVDLIQVGGDDFFAELVCFDAQKRHAKSRERGDQRLGDLIRIRGAVFVTRFYLAQRGRDDQQ